MEVVFSKSEMRFILSLPSKAPLFFYISVIVIETKTLLKRTHGVSIDQQNTR